MSDIQTPNTSIMDRLQQKHKAIAEDTTHDIDIPGYNGELFCRYRLLSGDQIDSIATNARATVPNRNEQLFVVACDNLIRSCEEFWVRDDGREIPLRDVEVDGKPFSDVPVRYDKSLAEFLRFTDQLPEPATARSVVMGLFGGRDLAITAHAASVLMWMMGSNVEIEKLVGELREMTI